MKEKHLEAVKMIEEENNLETWTTDAYRKEIKRKDSISIVASFEKETVGFLIARLINFKDDNQNFQFECELYNLAIKKELQNRGMGQKVFDAFIFTLNLRKVGSVYLEARKTNFKAIHFYKKNGFQKFGERKNFYQNPLEDGVLMKLDLNRQCIYKLDKSDFCS